jgi:hypothetical protein
MQTVKLRVGDIRVMPLTINEFQGKPSSKTDILLKGVNGFVPIVCQSPR